MPVRETEKYPPHGGAERLGQSHVLGKYALVSYLSSPVPKGVAIDYVVFATDGAPADSYNWTFKEIPAGQVTQLTTGFGVAQYQPKTVSTLEVRVEVIAAGSVAAKLKLKQAVIEPTGHLFTRLDTVLAATFGDSDVTLEVLHAFKPYIHETTRADYPVIPPAFLAALVYAEANRIGPEERGADLETAAAQLNGAAPKTVDDLYVQPLGVCQLVPETLAMVAPRAGSSATPAPVYTKWEELPAAESTRDSAIATIRAAYFKLSPKEKIEIYNLLRFPRTNIRMCGALLTQLKTRTHRWPGLSAIDMMSAANQNVFPILATEYKGGGTLAPREVKPSSVGKKIAGLVGKPYIYGNFDGPADISGVVVDQKTGQPIEGARTQLRGTFARVETAGLSCYVEASSASAQITKLSKGEFGVVEMRWDHPDKNWVWLKVDTPYGDGWINARSGAGWYARILDNLVPGGTDTTDPAGKFICRVTRRHMYRVHTALEGFLDGDSDYLIPPRTGLSISMEPVVEAVPEAAVTDLLQKFKNFKYVSAATVSVGQYPYAIEGLESTTAPLAVVESSANVRYNDCTTFTEALLVKAWQEELGAAFGWSWAKHRQWMITGDDADDRYSPIDAAEASGMLLTPIVIEPPPPGGSPSNAVPEAWTLVQGFENPPEGTKSEWGVGHNYIIVDRMPHPGPDRNQDKVLVLESNLPGAPYLIDGPGFRMIGDIDSAAVSDYNPGRDWWNPDTLPTWGKIKEKHKYLKMARLKIYDLSWVR